MFLRIVDVRKGDAHYRYLKLVETGRVHDKVIQKTLLNFGNIENWPKEKVDEFIVKLTRFFGLDSGTGPEDFDVEESLEFGACFALNAMGAGFRDNERVIICYNPERARITREKRTSRIEGSRQYLQSVVDAPPKQGRQRISPEDIGPSPKWNRCSGKSRAF